MPRKKGAVIMISKLAYLAVCLGVVFFCTIPGNAEYQLDPDQLRAELAAVGIKTGKIGKIGEIPYLEAELPDGASVSDICQAVPLLKENLSESLGVIAISNRLHPDLIRGQEGEPFITELQWLKIVLDTKVKSKGAYPEFDEKLAGKESHFVVDRPKQVLALYEFGQLVLFLPVATGKPGQETPKISGVVQGKAVDLWIEKYQVAMSWVVKLSPTICVYGGLMDGMFTTGGSIKTYVSEAEKLFGRVRVDVTSFEVR